MMAQNQQLHRETYITATPIHISTPAALHDLLDVADNIDFQKALKNRFPSPQPMNASALQQAAKGLLSKIYSNKNQQQPSNTPIPPLGAGARFRQKPQKSSPQLLLPAFPKAKPVSSSSLQQLDSQTKIIPIEKKESGKISLPPPKMNITLANENKPAALEGSAPLGQLLKRHGTPGPNSPLLGPHYYSTFAKRIHNVDTSEKIPEHIKKKMDSCDAQVQQQKNEYKRHSIFSRNGFRETIYHQSTQKKATKPPRLTLKTMQQKLESQFTPLKLIMKANFFPPPEEKPAKGDDKAATQTSFLKSKLNKSIKSTSNKAKLNSTMSLTQGEKLGNLLEDDKKSELMMEELNASLLGIFKELPENVKVTKVKTSKEREKEVAKNDIKHVKSNSSLHAMSTYFKRIIKNANKGATSVSRASRASQSKFLPKLQTPVASRNKLVNNFTAVTQQENSASPNLLLNQSKFFFQTEPKRASVVQRFFKSPPPFNNTNNVSRLSETSVKRFEKTSPQPMKKISIFSNPAANRQLSGPLTIVTKPNNLSISPSQKIGVGLSNDNNTSKQPRGSVTPSRNILIAPSSQVKPQTQILISTEPINCTQSPTPLQKMLMKVKANKQQLPATQPVSTKANQASKNKLQVPPKEKVASAISPQPSELLAKQPSKLRMLETAANGAMKKTFQTFYQRSGSQDSTDKLLLGAGSNTRHSKNLSLQPQTQPNFAPAAGPLNKTAQQHNEYGFAVVENASSHRKNLSNHHPSVSQHTDSHKHLHPGHPHIHFNAGNGHIGQHHQGLKHHNNRPSHASHHHHHGHHHSHHDDISHSASFLLDQYQQELKMKQFNDILKTRVQQSKDGMLPKIDLKGFGMFEDAEEAAVALGKEKLKVDAEDKALFNSVAPTPVNATRKVEKVITDQINDFRPGGAIFLSMSTILGRTQTHYDMVRDRVLVNSEKQISRFIGAYKKIEKIMEIDETQPYFEQSDNQQQQSSNGNPKSLINGSGSFAGSNKALLSSMDKDPIIEYLKEAKKTNMPPHKVAFKKLREGDKMEEEDEDEENIAYNLSAILITPEFAQAFSQSIKYNTQLNYLILKQNNLCDSTFLELLQNFPKTLKKLDITRNPDLTIVSYKALKEKLCSLKVELNYLILEGNEFGDDCCRVVCEMVAQLGTVWVLNMSKNNITCVGAEFIGLLLQSRYCKIKALIIHWNKIMGKGSAALAKSLENNENLQILDASFNSFGSSAVIETKKDKNNGWGGIPTSVRKQQKSSQSPKKPGKGAFITSQPSMIFTFGKDEDEGLKVENSTVSAHAWAKALIDNKTLVHLDFSFNNWRQPDVQALGEALKKNHTLLGLHLMGNEARIDELGFVMPDKALDAAASHVFTRIPQILKTGNIKSTQLMELRVASNCWICEGWMHLAFKIHRETVEKLLEGDDFRDRFFAKYGVNCKVNVNLHMSFDGYKAHRMVLNISGFRQFYLLYRMVPPGELKYFYTVGYSNELDKNTNTQSNNTNGNGNSQPQSTTNKQQTNNVTTGSIVASKGLRPIVDNNNPNIDSQGYKLVTDTATIDVPKLNYIEGDIQKLTKILTSIDIKKIKAVPRPEAGGATPRPKTPWTFARSFFARYPPFQEDTFVKCFEFDYNCSKIEKWLEHGTKPQRDHVYEYLRDNYKQIMEAYRYLSALAPSGRYWSIGTNVFSDTVFNCKGLVDYSTLKQSDVDLEFIATKASGMNIKWDTNPERQLIRYQFLEIFVRLAISKYYKTKICRSLDKAIIKTFDEHVLPYFNTFNSHDFRTEKMYNEDCDNAIQKNMQVLRDIYLKYSGKESIGGETKYMSLTEFFELIQSTQVIDEKFGAREINVLYNLSLNVQVDEIRTDRHCKMQFHEFVEALCRVADRVVVNLLTYGLSSSSSVDDLAKSAQAAVAATGAGTAPGTAELSTSPAKKPPNGQHQPVHHQQPGSKQSPGKKAKMVTEVGEFEYEEIDDFDEDLDDIDFGLPEPPQLKPASTKMGGGKSVQFPDLASQEREGTAQTSANNDPTERGDSPPAKKSRKEWELPLGHKLNEYIRKIALMSMGQDYAYNFIRKNNLQSQAFLYYSSWTSADQWVFKQLAAQQRRERAAALREAQDNILV